MPITLTQQTALITGASRGIGRGIALKLAEQGVKRIAINYKENDAAAEDAARLLKERGAAPLVIKADIGKVADIQRMFETIKSQFGGLDIFVSNARATLATGFYAEPMEIPLEAWQATFDTQATEFLVAVRAAVPMMGKNRRIIAITYAPGGQTGSLAALGRHGLSESREGGAGSLFRGRSRPEGHHGEHHQPGRLRRQRPQRAAAPGVPDDQGLARERLDAP